MNTPRLLLGLLAAMLSVAATGADKVYKWKDANGITHFTDQPPPKGTQFDSVSMKSGAAVTTDNANKDADTPVAGTGTGTDTAKVDPNKVRCEQARARLTILEGQSDVSIEQDGKAVPLNKEGRAAEMNVARAQIQAYCGGGESQKQ